MDNESQAEGTKADDYSLASDHRKRKKVGDMSESGGKAQPRLEVVWAQSEEDISMTTTLGVGDGEAEDVQVLFTDQDMTITLGDGSKQQWNFHGTIDRHKSRVQRKKRKFSIQVIKKEPGIWPALLKTSACAFDQDMEAAPQPSSDKAEDSLESITKEEEPVFNLQHVKHDFFEKDGNLTVHIYVKGVNKDAVKVRFEDKSFLVKFQTGDAKFLQLNEGASEDTVFSWQVNTKNSIIPSMCKHKVTANFIELTLKKASPERWSILEAPQRRETPTSSKPSSWIPAKNSSANPMQHHRLHHQRHYGEKPTCKVQPLNKVQVDTPVVTAGYTGLDNLGNTCFMNSVIQILSNTREFRDFFLNGQFQREINRDNVLGTGGHLAVAFGVLLKTLWAGTKYSCAPGKLKDLVAKKASQFTGFAQHDAQEFMAFLLDGLHEDLNRVKNKPYTETVESNGRPDEVVADEAWDVYKKRNDSFVVDLFQGQYKSKLVCPVCNKVSITFDPFLYLSVPLPKNKKTISVIFMWRDPHRKPVKFLVQLVKDSSAGHLKEILSRKTGVHPTDMRVFEVCRSLIVKHFQSNSDLSNIQPTSLIIVNEVLSAEVAGEEVVEIPVIQRTLVPHQFPTKCSACRKECEAGTKLKRCMKCLKVGYCDQACQRTHWSTHKPGCNPSPEPVGSPFILSVPKSQCTYARIARLMEGHARYSVDTFQPPVKAETASTSGVSTPAPASESTGLQLPSHPSGSNLSSSSGSQSSGSLSSLDSISSCSSTATLTAGAPTATFDMEDFDEEEHDRDEARRVDDDGSGAHLECNAALEEKGCQDRDSGVISLQSARVRSSSLETGAEAFKGIEKEAEDRELGQVSYGSQQAAAGAEKLALTNAVLGVQASMSTERSVPLFFIKPVTIDGHGVRGASGERLEDKGDVPLDLSGHSYLSMDWRNSDKLPSYVLVQSKPLEVDIDESALQAGSSDSKQLTLHQCLELFTEPETLAPDQAWYCPQCKEHREASKQMSLWRLPHTLIIQLKRFSFRNVVWREKLDTMVDFPTRDLDLTPYTMGGQGSGPRAIYDLYGVVNHKGGILGGHYTSMARCADLVQPLKNEVGWRLFDDSHVSTISIEKNVVTSMAYLLFYRRREPFVPSIERSLEEASPQKDLSLKESLTEDQNKEDEEMTEEPVSNKLYRDASSEDGEEVQEKCDPEKDEDNDYSLEDKSADHQVIRPKLDYTDMDAVD
ncbi:ubiquitin carboxyl-terminal hydrolase 19-like [Pomacea canaliculata]|uniref:ubiquitin carboxyl-terminal hydrolase 19-like n=1 Tax=Pomacea canaliculata TaxID=400727 RepID=UPI000D732B12|nr:ubiquitin carboxyl-terminal hydrolase 19-like [Pomacea canaliculata]